MFFDPRLVCMTKHFYTILISFFCYYSAGHIQVSGRVAGGDDNEGLAGVNIPEKGDPANGTVSDADGRYSLAVSGPSSVLGFSFIGYEMAEITVGSRETFNLALNPSLVSLSEVVVTAVGASEFNDRIIWFGFGQG